MTIPLILSDETLRDGEQQVGVVFSREEKEELARDLAAVGADFVALMPSVGRDEEELARDLLAAGVPVAPDVPARVAYVDMAHRIGAGRITLFASVSDILLAARGTSRLEILGRLVELVRHAHDVGMAVDVALEDASRADVDFVIELAGALAPRIDHLILCDTVGCLQPAMTGIWVREVIRRTGVKVGIHCHNDLGLAVDNTIVAVLAGATLISTTMTGIGERAGNAATEQVLLRLRDEHGLVRPGTDYEELETIAEKVRSYSGATPAPPLSPDAFRSETGLHVHAMLRDPMAYSIFHGIAPEIWFGKYSGRSNFRWLFERVVGLPQTEETYAHMRETVKRMAVEERRSFSAEEIITMYEERVFHASPIEA